MKPRHLIIGAGISGLALGWFLKKRFGENQTLTVLEASERSGGWIRTHRDQGFLFEEGPRSCRTKGAGLETLQLIEELGLCEEVISASPSAKKRFIYLEGQLHSVPNTFFSFLLSPLMKGVLPALWREWQVPPSNLEDESIADFIGRRLGKEIAKKLMDPLVSGIYAGDIDKLSLRSCFPEMHRIEQTHGSLVKGMFQKRKIEDNLSAFIKAQRRTPIFSFKNGMETLVKALQSRLTPNIQFSCRVKQISCEKDAVCVSLENGQELKGDRVFLAVPAAVAGSLLEKVDPTSAEKLVKSPCATVAVVNMGWNQKVLKHEGFGYLVPSSQKQAILGVVFDSFAFAEQNDQANQTRLTVMMGMHHPEVEKLSEEEIKKRSQEALNQHLGIFFKPDVIRVFVAKRAIPQYEVGHQARLLKIENDLKSTSASRLFLVGSAWRGVAVNDCIAEAKKVAESL